MSSMTLERKKRLQKRRDYLRVQKYGVRSFGRFLVAIAQHHRAGTPGRIGITVAKKVGPAHERNKIKRRLKHILRTHQTLFLEKTLIVVVRETAKDASFLDLHADLVDACKKIHHHQRHDFSKPARRQYRAASGISRGENQ